MRTLVLSLTLGFATIVQSCTTMTASHRTIDAHLAALPPDRRAALERLRKIIKAAAPKAVEGVSYGLPAFLLDGKAIAGFSATAAHCACQFDWSLGWHWLPDDGCRLEISRRRRQSEKASFA